MRKKDVIGVIGSPGAVAELLGIYPSAVSQWGASIPKLRAFELREKRPGIDKEIAEWLQKQSRDKAAVSDSQA